MGDTASTEAAGKEVADGKAEPSKGQLLQKYKLGEVIGQGAFGIVYLCHEREPPAKEYAVKMIDKVESPLDDIKREVEMLHRLAHPTVVRLVDVYFEKVFVCMVMDIFKGGDLIEGMQKHWEKKGMIPVDKVVHIFRRSVESIAWLHSKDVVHRDIKGDNFLMDYSDILNPQCKVYLSDFGTVCDCKPGERLKKSCGTKLYWSPEFYNHDYGVKVDIWALGVLFYGIASSRFPFRAEKDVKSKDVKFKGSIPESCQDLVLKMLTRDESKRLSGTEALEHEWLRGAGSAPGKETVEEIEQGSKMRETGAGAGVAERRLELVERILQAEARRAGNPCPQTQKLKSSTFVIEEEAGKRQVRYEWWPEAEAVKLIPEVGTQPVGPEDDKNSVQVVGKQLESHGIATAGFGKGTAKSLAEFAREVQRGESRLMLDAAEHRNLVRVVDILLLRISYGQGADKKFIIHSAEQYLDGRTRKDINQLPGSKKEPWENVKQTSERILKERLNMSDCKVVFDLTEIECFEESAESPHYPGVRTVYRKTIVKGEVSTSDAAILRRIGVTGSGECSCQDSAKNVWFYQWLTESECAARRVKMTGPPGGTEYSALVYAPVGFEEEELENYLQSNGIDPSKFGTANSRSLQEFSDELATGEASLARKDDGGVVRMVDVVVVQLRKSSGQVLVEVEEIFGEKKKQLNRLPAAKRRPDENEFLAARRLLTKTLMLDENAVSLRPNNIKVIEVEGDSHNYQGLRSVYRKRVVLADAGF